jgi:hypothetical protein
MAHKRKLVILVTSSLLITCRAIQVGSEAGELIYDKTASASCQSTESRRAHLQHGNVKVTATYL